MRVPVSDRLRPRLVRDVEDPGAAIDHPYISAIGPLGIDVGVVGADAGVEARVAPRRQRLVALARARDPPAAELRGFGGVADVDDAVGLVVAGVARLKIGRATRAMDGLAVDEPDLVNATRMWARAVEETDRAWLLGLRDIEELDPCRGHAHGRGLVGNRHDIAADLKGIGAHLPVRQVLLKDQPGMTRVAHIDRGEILGRRFMREPEDAPSTPRELQAHALADIAEARKFVVSEKLHVEGAFGHAGRSSRVVLADSVAILANSPCLRRAAAVRGSLPCGLRFEPVLSR